MAGATSSAGSTATLLNNPFYLAFDGYRNMYVIDSNNHRVQQYKQGLLSATTVAGFSLGSGSSRSELYSPVAIRVTLNATMFILDMNNYRVLKWQVGDPLGYIIAGGNGGGAAFTQIGVSYDIFLDSLLNLYVSEYGNNRVTYWTAGNTTASRLVIDEFLLLYLPATLNIFLTLAIFLNTRWPVEMAPVMQLINLMDHGAYMLILVIRYMLSIVQIIESKDGSIVR